ncbi:dnaJ homolog subfamily C member 27 isoform 3-T4 [Cyanocitta cristata]
MEANAAKRKEPRKALRVKVISMGDAEVGKSCIIKRYCEKRFVSKYLATIGIDYGVTKVQIRDREIKVNIFDMAGHPFFYEVRNEFYKDTQGVILVYDVGSKESFDSLDSWLAEMKQELGPHGNMENVVFVVCANKTFYSAIVDLCENGGKRPPGGSGIGFTREQADAIRRIRNSKDSWDTLGVKPGASRATFPAPGSGSQSRGSTPGAPPKESGMGKPLDAPSCFPTFRDFPGEFPALLPLRDPGDVSRQNPGKNPSLGSGVLVHSRSGAWNSLEKRPELLG